MHPPLNAITICSPNGTSVVNTVPAKYLHVRSVGGFSLAAPLVEGQHSSSPIGRRHEFEVGDTVNKIPHAAWFAE